MQIFRQPAKSISWNEMRRYLKARVSVQPAQRPAALKNLDDGKIVSDEILLGRE
jgi:hypothetical protein